MLVHVPQAWARHRAPGLCSDLAVWIEPKLGAAAFGVGFGFTPALLIWCLKRAQASHFIEDAFRVQLAFQPLERTIHWFAFSNNDFWHQFTSIPKKFAHSTAGQRQFTPVVHTPSNPVGKRTKMHRIHRISPDFEVR